MMPDDAVRRLYGRFPRLSTHGLHPLNSDGVPDTVDDLVRYAQTHESTVWLCKFWLDQCPRVSGPRPGLDSYSYKHEVEELAGRWIPHFAMLVAAELAGLEMIPNPRRDWAALFPLGAARPGRLARL